MRTARRYLIVIVALTVVAGAAPARAAVTAGHSGWFWGNPRPQGRALLAVDAAGSTVYATGNYGTITRSDDGGASWRGIVSGTEQYLDNVDALSPRSFVAAGGCTVVGSDDGGATMRDLGYDRCGTRDEEIVAISFPASGVVYVVDAGGRVLRMGAGGRGFKRVGQMPQAYDVVFTGPETGVAAAGSQLRRTTDGGRTWRVVAHGDSLAALAFAGDRVGYAFGYGTVLATDDGGQTWRSRPLSGVTLDTVSCGDALHCAGLGFEPILYTDDGFATTKPAVTDLSAFEPREADLVFTSPRHVVYGGTHGRIALSDDGGATYRSVGFDPSAYIESELSASSARVAWFSTSAGVLKTDDGGARWRVLRVRGYSLVSDSWFAGTGKGYAVVGDRVLATVDGGTSWEERGRVPGGGQIWSSGDGASVLVSARAGVMRSTDGARHFERVTAAALASARHWSLDARGGPIVAWGRDSIATSADGGAHWRAMSPPPGDGALTRVSVPAADTAFALREPGRPWRTTDGGRTWRELFGLGNVPRAGTMSFADPKHGFIASASPHGDVYGWVLRTSDGGDTWRPQAVDNDGAATGGLVATSRRRGIVLTDQQKAFFTHSGGDRGAPSHLTLSASPDRWGGATDVHLTGRLRPARAGRPVWITRRSDGATHWARAEVVTRSDGSFRLTWTITSGARFVAQWPGDTRYRGAGTPAVRVRGSTRGR